VSGRKLFVRAIGMILVALLPSADRFFCSSPEHGGDTENGGRMTPTPPVVEVLMTHWKHPPCPSCGRPERENPANLAIRTVLAGFAARLLLSWIPEVVQAVWDHLTSW
jgi:hypothetical protein